jgi:hypothetical protein
MSKYDPLRDHLRREHTDHVTMTFDDIGALVSLPGSARIYPEWWANEDVVGTSHTQCRSWQAAGYRAEVDIIRGVVTFSRKT